MSKRKVKSSMVRRVMTNGYRGFMPVEEKIRRDMKSINKAKDNVNHPQKEVFEFDLNNLNLEDFE